MTPEELKIKESAKKQLKLGSYSSQDDAIFFSFLNGAFSDEAKEYHIKNMYSVDEVKELAYIAFKAGGDNRIKPYTTDLCNVDCPDFNEWFEQNKKKSL